MARIYTKINVVMVSGNIGSLFKSNVTIAKCNILAFAIMRGRLPSVDSLRESLRCAAGLAATQGPGSGSVRERGGCESSRVLIRFE